MPETPKFTNDLLKLIFQATPIANIAANAATTPATQYFVSLHTTNPVQMAGTQGDVADQAMGEIAYTAYVRQPVPRTAVGWKIEGSVIVPADVIVFPEVEDVVTPFKANFFGLGTLVSGVGVLLYVGSLVPSIAIANGQIPRIDPFITELNFNANWGCLMPLIARLGDPGSHGGQIISSASRTKAEGKLIARIGDSYACPIHGTNPIITGCSRTPTEGPQTAYDGSRTACGASIIATATRTKVE